MTPVCTEWWLRPVMSAARVGEQSAVEWKAVYRRPAWAMRSSVGVGMTPPNVLGAAKPTSSVMMRRTLGAPLGGLTCGGHQGFDCARVGCTTPPNLAGGRGRCVESTDVAAAGEPGAVLTCPAVRLGVLS